LDAFDFTSNNNHACPRTLGVRRESIAGLAHPLTFRFHGKRKDGTVFLAETDMIPISWRGYPISYRFVHEVM
jgi:hypothetical protein